MLSNESKKSLRAQFQSFGQQVQNLGSDHREEARELYAILKLDGAIKAITPPEHLNASILDLASAEIPEYENIYAVDGGSTRAKVLENGTMICAFQAVLTADGNQALNGVPLEAFRSLAFVSHSQRVDLGGAQSELYDQDEYAHLWRLHLHRDFLSFEIERVVTGLARAAAESYHTLRLLEHLNTESSLLMLDGNLYPVWLYYHIVGPQKTSSWDSDSTSWTEWEPAKKILKLPIDVVDQAAHRNLALVGINKNPGTSSLLEFTLDPESHNWSSDAQFIKAVLSQTPKDALGYTSWFVQEEYSSGPRKKGEEPNTMDIFNRLSSFGLELEPRSYHTCFFYVYDPRVLSVIKIEVPRVILDSHDPMKLRSKVLREIARGKGVPGAIRRADSRARITDEEAMRLFGDCGIELDYYYDHSRGEPI
jgi:hypothetical protein